MAGKFSRATIKNRANIRIANVRPFYESSQRSLFVVARTEQSDPWKFQSYRPLDELARLGLFPDIALVYRIALDIARFLILA